ncbi:MAG TPA: hypothetical protein VFG95_00605, partial [Nitrospiria bacterium]|nr:hypothetical protein [Nitrospiria bacterium]
MKTVSKLADEGRISWIFGVDFRRAGVGRSYFLSVVADQAERLRGSPEKWTNLRIMRRVAAVALNLSL